MFIHLGENVIIHAQDVITIIDRKLIKSSSIVKEFLEFQSEKVVELANGDTKSVVVTKNNIYFSPLSSSTLKKRAHLSTQFDLLEGEISSISK